MNEPEKLNRIERFFTDYKNTITIISGLFIVVTFFIAADNYINNKVEEKITDTAYIHKLAKVLRPFSIFDIQGTITYDHGGENFIEKITVEKEKDDIKRITIQTKKYLQNPPVLIYVGHDNYAYISKRVNTNMWEYNLSSYNLLIDGTTGGKIEPFFIIEIMQ